MARVQLFTQTRKVGNESIKLRFRLKDGRGVQLYCRSEITATIDDLSKFEANGTPKKRANYSRKLAKIIADRMALLQTVYDDCIKSGILLTSKVFEERVDMVLHPEKYQTEKPKVKSLLERFDEYISDGTFSEARKAGYRVTEKILSRYLQIVGRTSIQIDEVDKQFLIDFHQFVVNEYKYVKRYKRLYSDIKSSNVPMTARDANTVAIKMKMLSAFFNCLEANEEVTISPFRRLTKGDRKSTMSETYGEPFALRLEELQQLINADVPEALRATRDAFALQSCVGCRISDFQRLSMQNVMVSDGIPYIIYVPKKTAKLDSKNGIKTPLVKVAFDIVKKTQFDLPIHSPSGQAGYNVKIRELLKFVGIDRTVASFEDGNPVESPLYAVASNRLARKTFLTLTSRAQINKYAAGLHKAGSGAVKSYLALELSDLFRLLSFAFEQPTFAVDRDLNIIND
jgi:hypothetical protein